MESQRPAFAEGVLIGPEEGEVPALGGLHLDGLRDLQPSPLLAGVLLPVCDHGEDHVRWAILGAHAFDAKMDQADGAPDGYRTGA